MHRVMHSALPRCFAPLRAPCAGVPWIKNAAFVRAQAAPLIMVLIKRQTARGGPCRSSLGFL